MKVEGWKLMANSMKEVVKVMPEAFSQFSDSQVLRFIRGMK